MPKNSSSGPAVRRKVTRDKKGRHPLLQIGTPHYTVWQAIVRSNPSGGVTAAQLKQSVDQYHPQILADLQKALLVAKRGKKGSSFVYVADDAGKGIIPQSVQIEVELYETETGAFVTRTFLVGRQDEPGKITKYLGSRKISMDVPGEFSPKVKAVVTTAEPDEEPDPYDQDTRRARKAAIRDNVIIEVSPLDYTNANTTGVRKMVKSDHSEEEGCVIDG